MIHVFVWKKCDDSVLGHASMYVSGDAGKFYVSWYPASDVGDAAVFQKEVCVQGKHFSSMREEKTRVWKGRDPDICTPPINGLNESKIAKGWDKILKEQQWCMAKQNCSTVIYHLLRLGGAPSSREVKRMSQERKQSGHPVQGVETNHLAGRIAGELKEAWTPVAVYNYANAVAQLKLKK